MTVPKKCKGCGALLQRLQLQSGVYGSPYKQHGWYRFYCGTKWHPEHGWSLLSPWCALACEKVKNRKLRAEIRHLKREGAA